jgi:hypothetical protein
MIQIPDQNAATFFFEMGPIRPPSEGRDYSLLIRPTRNCHWNLCEFCVTYKGKKFSYRKVEDVKRDLEVVRILHDEILGASREMGPGGRVTQEVVAAVWEGNPRLYADAGGSAETVALRRHNLLNVAAWLSSGAKTVFLQDADSLVMRTPDLLEILQSLKAAFPSVERVTSYARSRSCARKSLEELQALQEAGLSRLHLGLESGYDEVLKEVRKGATAAEHLEAGRKIREAGITLSEYVMPGLGGRKWSREHALASAQVLTAIRPDFIRLRSLVLRKNSPLWARHRAGGFDLLSEDEVMDEIGLFIENLYCPAYLASDQMCNLLPEMEGQLPQDKDRMLATLAAYRGRGPLERAAFRLKRRLTSWLSVYGPVSGDLESKVQQAQEALRKESPDWEIKVEEAVSALKEGFI